MTKSQSFAIFCLAKYDVRKTNLTKGTASNLIDILTKGSAEQKALALEAIAAMPNAVKKGEAKPTHNWQAVYDEARAAGLAAGQGVTPVPMVVNEHDGPALTGNEPIIARTIVNDGVCGFAWVTLRPANSSFALWAKKNNLSRGGKIWVHDFNQSLTRKTEYAQAFSEVLRKHGVNAYAGSNID